MSVHPTGSRRESGYTLVEILVAAVLVLTLAGLGFSGIHQANASAITARTLAQLREIGVACQGWTSDHANRFPPSWDNTDGRNQSYAQVLDPYLHGVENYREVDSKFIGFDKRLPVRITPASHPITFSLNRAVCSDVTTYGDYQEELVSIHDVDHPSAVILAIDGCQNPRNHNQSNASTYEVHFAVRENGPAGIASEPIPIGPDRDTPAADGWIRYPSGQAHALMCDGSARIFAKGTILKRNIWRNVR